MATAERKRMWAKRMAWMLGIWLISIAALGLAAYLLRLIMNAVGMTA